MSDLLTRIADDLGAFFDSASGFAVEVTIGDTTIAAIFDHDYGEAYGVAGEVPVLMCRTSDVSLVPIGDAVTIAGTAYRVAAIRPDGTGVTVLQLEETS